MWSLNVFLCLNLVIHRMSMIRAQLSFGYCNLNFSVHCLSNLQGKVKLEQELLD